MDNNDNIQNIQDKILKNTLEILNENNQISFSELHASAQTFIAQINNLINNHIIVDNKNVNNSSNSIKIPLQTFYREMKRNQSITHDVILYTEAFSHRWKLFLGRETYLTYIDENGEPLFLNSVKTGELYAKVTRNAGRGNLTKESLKDFNKNELGLANEELQNKILECAKERTKIYQEALSRLEEKKFSSGGHKGNLSGKENLNIQELIKNGAITKKKNFSPSRANRSFYYLEMNQYHWSQAPINKGHLAEGYFRAIFEQSQDMKQNIFPSSPVEEGLKTIAQEKYVRQDNVAEVVKSDVNGIISNQGQIHFNVKTGNRFSTASVGQYFRLAERISLIPEAAPLNREDFLNNNNENIKIINNFRLGSKTVLEQIEKNTKKQLINKINE